MALIETDISLADYARECYKLEVQCMYHYFIASDEDTRKYSRGKNRCKRCGYKLEQLNG